MEDRDNSKTSFVLAAPGWWMLFYEGVVTIKTLFGSRVIGWEYSQSYYEPTRGYDGEWAGGAVPLCLDNYSRAESHDDISNYLGCFHEDELPSALVEKLRKPHSVDDLAELTGD
jgi:hypothetical protein